MRILLNKPPFQDLSPYRPEQAWQAVSDWPGTWVLPPPDWEKPWVAAFRCRFTLEQPASDHFHVTADERYELYLDGEFVGRGAERGDKSHWSYETYFLELRPGFHTLVARVWALGPLAPWAQISLNPGFLCTPESPELVQKIATGVALWEIRRSHDITFVDMARSPGQCMGGGPSEIIDTQHTTWGWECGKGEGWHPAVKGIGGNHGFHSHSTRPVHWLTPARLPNQMDVDWQRFSIHSQIPETPDGNAQWAAFFNGKCPITIPAGSQWSVVVDLGDYVCAYPELKWSGGGKFSLGWAEALHDPQSGKKTCGPNLENACFKGPYDEVIADGGPDRHWHPMWWRCGRFIRLKVETTDVPLVLKNLSLHETRYPLDIEGAWNVPDARLQKVFSLCLRTLQMCAHETYMDCPYYEQLMYVGDTRLQCLLTYALARDTLLPRKALELFDSSRMNPAEIVAAAHPNHGGQLIPPFALWWVTMVHDFACWRGDPAFIRARLPGVRAVLDQFAKFVDSEGILHAPVGWNFLDWAFPGGVPPGGLPTERNSSLHAQWTMALTRASELETFAGEPEMAAMYERKGAAAAQALTDMFWDEKLGLVADDALHSSHSEHAQCLALLANALSPGQQQRVWEKLENGGVRMAPVSSYFAHYLFEACMNHGHSDLFFRRLAPWKACADQGFSTTPECFGESRSDCHAWSAHPLFHFLTGVLGIRPASFGFAAVDIAPQMGPLEEASGTLPHPLGLIHVRLKRQEAKLHAEVELPAGLHGTFRAYGNSVLLHPGLQAIAIEVKRFEIQESRLS